MSKIRQRKYHVELMSPHEDQIPDPVRDIWNCRAHSNREALLSALQDYVPIFDLPVGSIALVGRSRRAHSEDIWENWPHTHYVITQGMVYDALHE
jgi:hypothetical protein